MLYYIIFGYLLTHTTHSAQGRLALAWPLRPVWPRCQALNDEALGSKWEKIWEIVIFISKLPMIYLWLVIFIPNFIVIYYSTVHLYSTLLVIYQISKFHSKFHKIIVVIPNLLLNIVVIPNFIVIYYLLFPQMKLLFVI
jgi:hypothetical protein